MYDDVRIYITIIQTLNSNCQINVVDWELKNNYLSIYVNKQNFQFHFSDAAVILTFNQGHQNW